MSTLCIHDEGCGACGGQLPARRRRWCSNACRDAWYVNHIWTYAREACFRRQDHHCLGCGQWATEVDHIVPRHGQKLHVHSCLHHQDNLRALCHDCHVHRAERLDATAA